MIIRIVIILLCLVFFINGCNSLISQFFGTHKLRTFTMGEVLSTGLGDADYVEISGAHFNGDFVYQAASDTSSPPIILYPVLARDSAGQRVALLAWSADFHSPCVEAGDCVLTGERKLRGVIREVPSENQEAFKILKARGYDWPALVPVVNEGEAPIAWYWNALVMLAAAGFALGMEAIYNRKNKQDET